MSDVYDSNPHSIAFFAQGKFRASPSGILPDILKHALHVQPCGGEAFDQILADEGFVCTENYGTSGESLDVWTNNSMWYVEHWTSDGVIDFRVVIFGLVDYIAFQASWLAPMASKIMSEDLYCKWRHDLLYNMEENGTNTDSLVN